jgi:hypothetical protein
VEVYVVTRFQTASQHACDKLSILTENVEMIGDSTVGIQENESSVLNVVAIEGISELFDESNREKLLSY